MVISLMNKYVLSKSSAIMHYNPYKYFLAFSFLIVSCVSNNTSDFIDPLNVPFYGKDTIFVSEILQHAEKIVGEPKKVFDMGADYGSDFNGEVKPVTYSFAKENVRDSLLTKMPNDLLIDTVFYLRNIQKIDNRTIYLITSATNRGIVNTVNPMLLIQNNSGEVESIQRLFDNMNVNISYENNIDTIYQIRNDYYMVIGNGYISAYEGAIFSKIVKDQKREDKIIFKSKKIISDSLIKTIKF